MMGLLRTSVKSGISRVRKPFVAVVLAAMSLCGFECTPEPYQPECMNDFICYAYTPDEADSVKVDLFYEDSLIESETHSGIVGLPNSKHPFFDRVKIQISVFCNGEWFPGEEIEISNTRGRIQDVHFSQSVRGKNIFTEEQLSKCPQLAKSNVGIYEKDGEYCKD
ncbi:MAG: hypothetical protein J5615_10665 [Fibrobacter sp.]|nr:hypothetical protein [Fibrobacter sp.]